MELLNQPFTGQLGNLLIEFLDSSDYHTLNIVVAFAKNSGVLRIKDAVERFRGRGGKVNVYVGIDLGVTSYEALTALLLHTDSLNVVHSEKGQTFHPKIYQFVGEDKGLMVVGSHNLTGGGLWTNFESSVLLSTTNSTNREKMLLEGVDNHIKNLDSLKNSIMSIHTQDDIDELLQNTYIFKEVTEQVRLAKAFKQNGNRKRLFGNGVPARLPRIITSKENKVPAANMAAAGPNSLPTSDGDKTIWFETRRMTGGSRNILDLSKKSLVERGDPIGTSFDLGESGFMRGGVEFFGLDPTATDRRKNITLNFEGVDYTGNTILFPDGKTANGTWRLQIKGSSDKDITEVFATKAKARNEEYYLINKVITFTKIQDDYYFISVFPESELEDFKAASHILARNGSTKLAKWLGIL